MPQTEGRRQYVRSTPSPSRYKSVALKPETYEKVVYWANHLREEWGRCTINDAIDFLVDSAGVPNEEE